MLDSTQKILSEAQQAWPAWNDLILSNRGQILQNWAASFSASLPVSVPNKVEMGLASKMVHYQIQQSDLLLAETLTMPGPTGEINELSTAGRGVFVIAAQQAAPITAIVGLMSCALIAGNAVLLSLSLEKQCLANELCSGLHLAGINHALVSHINNQELLPLITSPLVAGVGFMGNVEETRKINRCLANREGQIAQLITETDLKQLPTITDSHLLFRFITEKTQTINITAVGGNATLLALGCGDQ